LSNTVLQHYHCTNKDIVKVEKYDGITCLFHNRIFFPMDDLLALLNDFTRWTSFFAVFHLVVLVLKMKSDGLLVPKPGTALDELYLQFMKTLVHRPYFT
jgi:hypothetical protein